MAVYIFSLLFNLIAGLIIFEGRTINPKTRKKKVYAIITIIQMTFIAGSRASTVGWDTAAYINIFNEISNYQSLFEKTYLEPGFVFLCKIISISGGTERTFLYISSFIISTSCISFVYHYSNNLFYSVFILLSLPYYYTSMDILRQYFSFSVLLLGYVFIRKRSFLKYILIVIIACQFHSSSIFYVSLYFFPLIKWTNIKLALVAVLSIILFFNFDTIFLFVLNLSGNFSSYQGENFWIGNFSGGIKTFFMYFSIMLILWIELQMCNKVVKNEFFGYVVLLCVSSLLFTYVRMLIRVMMLCIPFVAVAIPQILCPVTSAENKILKYDFGVQSTIQRDVFNALIVGICILYHSFLLKSGWQNVVPYEFFFLG